MLVQLGALAVSTGINAHGEPDRHQQCSDFGIGHVMVEPSLWTKGTSGMRPGIPRDPSADPHLATLKRGYKDSDVIPTIPILHGFKAIFVFTPAIEASAAIISFC